MNLRSRIFLILVVVVALYSAFDYVIHRSIILPSYTSLEETEAREDLARCLQALDREIHYLDKFTNDWASWDDMYRFVKDRNSAFMESNLAPQTFLDNNLDIIYLYDAAGRLVWGESHDHRTGKSLDLPELAFPSLSGRYPLKRHESVNNSVAGVYMTAQGPLLVASRPVITSARKGPIRGSLVMGRLLNDKLIRALVEQTRVRHEYWPVADASMPTAQRSALDRITRTSPFYLTRQGAFLHIHTLVYDIQGERALVLSAEIPRYISAKGIDTMRYAIRSNLIVGAIILVVLMFMLQRTIIKPLSDLTVHAIRIRDSNDLSLRSRSTRKDEIGVLSGELDRMVARLENIYKHLEWRVARRTADLKAVNYQLQKEITERKRAEDFLREARDDLERRVGRQTAALVETNAQLTSEIVERRQAEKELHLYHQKLRSLSSELLLTEERERRRLATDLHDRIGQALTIAMFRIGELQASVPASGRLSKPILELSKVIDRVLQDTRQLTFELSPPVLYELGLEAALEWLAEQFQTKYGLSIAFHDDKTAKPLENALRVLIFQAGRELLFNVVKHAQAKHIDLTIHRNDNALHLSIEDDGVGFDAKTVNSTNYKNKGFGLFSIRERLRHIGGSLEVHSAVNTGTCAVIVMPLNVHAKEKARRAT